jgi:hypothetical protein
MAGIKRPEWHGLSVDAVIAFSDAELVRRMYGACGRVEDCVLSDELYFLVTETLERFAPSVERSDLEHVHADDPVELAAALEGMRRREVARLIRDTFEGDDA